jgi:hypothetical protein
MNPGGVLVHLGQNVIYELNATGMTVWSLLADGLSRDAIIDRVSSEFDVSPDQAALEVDALVDDLHGRGLLTP